MSEMRDAFEKWYVEATNYNYNLMRDTDGHYCDEALDAMWWAWQASRAQGDAEPVLRQFYQDGEWHNFINEEHEENTVLAGYEVRTLYTRPPSGDNPNEKGTNRYGLDMEYFRNLFNRELMRPLVDFRPDELARVLARAARTADANVLREPEFQGDAEPVNLSDYDAGYLNDWGGGNVGWWQDYIRAEVERANEFWRDQIEQGPIFDCPPIAGVPECWKDCLEEMIEAMRLYQMDCDEEPPYKHKAMMARARALLDSAPQPPKQEGE